MKRRALASILGGALLAAAGGACGDSHATPDAQGACWPLAMTSSGMVELGTGDLVFQPMPATLGVIHDGSQGDPFIELFGRIRDIPPGDNPQNSLDPSHPKTKVSATVDGLAAPFAVPCPANLGYRDSPSAPGSYDMVHSLRLGIGLTPLGDVIGKHAHLVIEVVGRNGAYAKDEKDVMLVDGSPGMFTDAGIPPD